MDKTKNQTVSWLYFFFIISLFGYGVLQPCGVAAEVPSATGSTDIIPRVALPRVTLPTVTLNEAFQIALERNEEAQKSHEEVIQANELVARLKGSLFPEITLNATHLIQPTPNDPIARQFSPPQQTTTSLSVAQPLFRGFREFAGLRRQKQVSIAQEAIRRHTGDRLYQEVAMNYLNILTLEHDLKNLQDQVEIYGRRVKELQVNAQRGESSLTELLSAGATENSLQAELRLAQGKLDAARETFHSLTGRPRNTGLLDPKLISESSGVRLKLEDYLVRLEGRPDVQAAIAQRDAAYEGISIARGGHLPTLDAIGNYYFERPGFLKDLKWDVSLRLSLPLFSGGAIQAQLREAASKDKEAELELARIRRLAEEEVRSLYQILQSRFEHLAFLKKAVLLAEENVSVSQKEFRHGLVRGIDVQFVLGEYRMVRRSLDQAYFATQMDLLRLEVAAGLRPDEVSL